MKYYYLWNFLNTINLKINIDNYGEFIIIYLQLQAIKLALKG